MFLKNITIHNYKSIQDASVDFEGGLNILIGKNGAGKSNLIQYINQNVSYYQIRFVNIYNKNLNLEYQYTIRYEVNNSTYELIISFKSDKSIAGNEVEYTNQIKVSKKENGQISSEEKTVLIKDGDTDFEFRKLLAGNDLNALESFYITYIAFQVPQDSFWLTKTQTYQLNFNRNLINPYTINSNQGYPAGIDILFHLERILEYEFFGLGAADSEQDDLKVVKEFLEKTFNDFKEEYALDSYLSKYSPIGEIRLNPNINIYSVDNKILIENLKIEFKVNDSWIPWSYLSDGTKRLFYLITQCLSINGGLLLIEEPELGVHPHQLFSIMEFLKEQAESKQIIISTHSPDVLNALSPEELNKITVVKMTAKGTQFYKLNDDQKEKAREYMTEVNELSYYWVHSDLENE